jgi:hypothetical protein
MLYIAPGLSGAASCVARHHDKVSLDEIADAYLPL